MYDQGINQATVSLPEDFWYCPDNRETQILPEFDSSLIRRYHEIKLHGKETQSPGFLKRMQPHGTANSLSTRFPFDEIARVTDMRTEPFLIWLEEVSGN